MRASYDGSAWARFEPVTIAMSAEEFTETVEWLESLDPDDGATKHWRAWHDRIMPLPEEAS